MFKKISGVLKENYTKKFFIFAIAAFLAVFFANAAANASLQRSFLKKISENSVKRVSAEYAEKINCKISSKLDILNLLANSEKTAKYLTASAKQKSGVYADGFSEMKSLLQTCAEDPYISSAWIASDSQSFYITSDGDVSDKSYDIKSSPWYSYFISKPEPSVWFSGFSKGFISDKTGVIFVKTIFENGNLLGYAGIEISSENMSAMLEELETSQNYYPVLTDFQGNKIYSSQNINFISNFPPNGMEIKNAIDASLQSETGFLNIKNGKSVYFAQSPLADIKILIFYDGKESLADSNLISGRHIFLLVCSAVILRNL